MHKIGDNMDYQDYPNTVLSILSTGVMVLDSRLYVISSNPACEQILGISTSKMHNRFFPDLFSYSGIDFKKCLPAVTEKDVFSSTNTVLVTTHRKIFVDITITCLEQDTAAASGSTVADNKPAPMLLMEFKKVSRERVMEHERQQESQQDAARELVRSLAHEIKNPLGGLRGAAQLIQKDCGRDSSLFEYCKIIIEQADRLKNLVDRLLGPQKAIPAKYDNIHSIIEKVRKLLELEITSGISIERDYDPSLPEIKMDSEKMEQAFLNIIGNAVAILKENKVNPGLITIQTRADYCISIRGKLCHTAIKITITDNGPGIPPEIADTIFYPMVSRRTGGTGLGLPIAQNIIAQHHGKIECQSFSGQTQFIIYLPLVSDEINRRK